MLFAVRRGGGIGCDLLVVKWIAGSGDSLVQASSHSTVGGCR
jgi:hypothetical protein